MRDTDRPSRPIRDVGVLLLPDFALIAYSCAVEPFRAANIISGRPLYRWRHVSVDGGPVRASNGMHLVPEHRVGEPLAPDLLLVCAGGNPTTFADRATFAWLRQLARAGSIIGGVSGGPYILARAGLLDGYRCAIHWEHVPTAREAFPRIELSDNLFEIDRNRVTCSGGTAPLDLTHALIAREHGRELASDVLDWFIHTNLRPGDGPQRLPARERFAVRHPKLVRVLEAMESALEEPLPAERLAALAGLSVRQLERLFSSHLHRSIGAHYRELRLRRARVLLAQSTLSVLEVAVACGFVSASHFSRAYRARFGRPPSTDQSVRVGLRHG
ncbi:GlxA family transcriptional regulator [soil metagenome]